MFLEFLYNSYNSLQFLTISCIFYSLQLHVIVKENRPYMLYMLKNKSGESELIQMIRIERIKIIPELSFEIADLKLTKIENDSL